MKTGRLKIYYREEHDYFEFRYGKSNSRTVNFLSIQRISFFLMELQQLHRYLEENMNENG